MLSYHEIRNKYLSFFKLRGHIEIPPISLVPQGDPTTLFTGSGMQPMVPYLLGEKHPSGKRLTNIQPCFRSQDIEEVGDNRHTTMFEMMGNWSLGDYFKQEQLTWFFTFLTDKNEGLGLDPKRLFVSVFRGSGKIPCDNENIELWKKLFLQKGIKAEVEERIYLYGTTKNWWSRSGEPELMPVGEPGGPDSEVFYQFDIPHNPSFGKECHPNCDCGRFMEIGNSVFMEYIKQSDGSFKNLPQKNVDFGGGLERISAALNNTSDIFKTDVYAKIIDAITSLTNTTYDKNENTKRIRIIADHFKASVFLIKDGVLPSNKEQGYFLRRLLRRSFLSLRYLQKGCFIQDPINKIIEAVINTYEGVYFDYSDKTINEYFQIIVSEADKFTSVLKNGKKIIDTLRVITGLDAFNLYQSYGIPFELTAELAREKNIHVSYEEYIDAIKKHKDQSRSSSIGVFKGGLADSSEKTIKYHTATHVLHQVLRNILGDEVRQEGSNITADRLRFDFRFSRLPSREELNQIEKEIHQIILHNYPVRFVEMKKKEAEKVGALSFFREKYPDVVKVYYIGEKENDIRGAFSKEFCGGPHVKYTGEIGNIKIDRVKKIGENIIRIYMK